VPEDTPDAVPRPEPRSRYGNPPFYEVFGQRYYVLDTAEGYVERGLASWYGRKFHGKRTSSGEPYDMYAMTAAHKTLPLPTYVRVTNLENGRSVIVKVNDRGPFHANRIIDLSYAAATRLGIAERGTGMVEVRAIPVASAQGEARETARRPPAEPPKLYVQVGAFAQQANAERVLRRLEAQAFEHARVVPGEVEGRRLFRVRIRPLPDPTAADAVMTRLDAQGIREYRIVID
jgi:rare lipoprotein A